MKLCRLNCICIVYIMTSLVIASCKDNASPTIHRESKFLMGTLVTVSVPGDPASSAEACQSVLREISRLEDLTSFHRPSPLNDINNAAGEAPVRVDPELVKIITHSLTLAKNSNGTFDPTIGAVSRLWNFSGSGEPRLPSREAIEKALDLVGWHHVQINEAHSTVFLPRKGMALDLGGIVKGYALSRASKVLKDRGVESGLVDIGGDILALGSKAQGSKWRIGVKDPRRGSSVRAVIELSDQFILTSGDYERFFVHNGTRYHHILDPKTGYPAKGVRSVTIVTTDPMMTTSAGVFVMGISRGLAFLEEMPDVYGWLIDDQDKIHETRNARGLFKDATARN